MMLQHVFFIDDDKPTTIINERLAKRTTLFSNITIFNNSISALNFLIENKNNALKLPDILFLDINMPALNGWSFLDSYKKHIFIKKTRIIMLSTSKVINDIEQEDYKEIIFSYETKPLSIDKIKYHSKE